MSTAPGNSQAPEDALLKRPLYVFDLPPEILLTLQAKAASSSLPITDPEPTPPKEDEGFSNTEQSKGDSVLSTSCALCGLAFPNVLEQRSHIKSDLHGYNLKQKLRGLATVTDAHFEKLVGELDESISGSDSSVSDDDEDDHPANNKSSTLSTLLRKQANVSANKNSSDDFSPKKRKRGAGKPPLIWFTTSVLPSNTSLGIYRTVFTDEEQEDTTQFVQIVRKKQLAPAAAPSAPVDGSNGVPLPRTMTSPHIFLCMVGGGHFAGMIVSLAPKLSKKAAGGDERQATVLAHKTFHRYTTRRKQGGSQSANDSAKGAAHSAGASIRRHNEAALVTEIRQLLADWKSLIEDSQLLFVRATGSGNRRTLFGPYDGQVLRQNDPRLRGFPFSTRRATQAELMRAFVELTRVKVSQIDEAALAAAAAATQANAERAAASTKQGSIPSTPSQSKVSKEDEAALLHTSQLQALIRRSKAPAVLSYLSSNSLSPDFLFLPVDTQQNYHAPTPLHLAASVNSPAVILALLTKAEANPCSTNGEGKTAFDIAGDRSTRDAFRVARHELGEARWDWNAAHVPAPLSKADADKREERDRNEAEKKESERRTAEMMRLKKEGPSDAVSVGKKGGKPLGVGEKTGAEKREEEARGMTPEMRMRLERERRARAAEERMRRM
ncbi:MAG: hypothetical protein M1835_005319 [Candelina submexicana]|nr:MAG: hypothetical protein M1835_005319 [Candelina submexicana]